MKIWKRNAIVATVLVLICAGVYLNWNKTQPEPIDLTQTLNAEQLMGDSVLTMGDGISGEAEASSEYLSSADYFAQIRLSRQR